MLLSINPEHVENILSGEKRFEFRKIRCKSDIDKIVIYATAPVMKVVAEVDVDEIIVDEINAVWQQTKKYAGISYKFYREYYKGKKTAVAYKLSNVEIYAEPRHLSEFGLKCAPQSFAYIF